jgi:predicted dehydrogenase
MRVGIVGCGLIASVHIPYVRSQAGVEIVAVTDRDDARARDTAARFGIAGISPTLGHLLEVHRPEVVHVLTPPQTHAPLAIQAMDAGCHVLVEKPMAVNLAEAEAMETTARRRGVKLCVDHNHLFDPAVVRARALVAGGRIGEPVWAEAFEGFSVGAPDNPYVQPGAPEHWVHRLPGGIFHNLAPHPVYLLLAFLDPPKALHAVARKTGRVPSAFADELRVLVTADNGLGCFMVSLSIQPFMKYVHLYGTEGTIRVNLTTNSLTIARNRDLPRALARGMLGMDEAAQLVKGTASNAIEVARGRLRAYPGLGVLIAEFYRSIREDRPAPVDGQAGREVVRILDQVWEQIAPGSSTAIASPRERAR